MITWKINILTCFGNSFISQQKNKMAHVERAKGHFNKLRQLLDSRFPLSLAMQRVKGTLANSIDST